MHLQKNHSNNSIKYNPEIHHRRSIRLQGYNYSKTGAYFITVCTQNRENLFGEIVDKKMILNEYEKIIDNCWRDLPNHYKNAELDCFVIMPNHFHGVLNIAGTHSLYSENNAPTLGKIVAFFKYQTTKQFNALRNIGMQKLWQRNYYEHVIRNNDNLDKIREYIINNPVKWPYDRNHP